MRTVGGESRRRPCGLGRHAGNAPPGAQRDRMQDDCASRRRPGSRRWNDGDGLRRRSDLADPRLRHGRPTPVAPDGPSEQGDPVLPDGPSGQGDPVVPDGPNQKDDRVVRVGPNEQDDPLEPDGRYRQADPNGESGPTRPAAPAGPNACRLRHVKPDSGAAVIRPQQNDPVSRDDPAAVTRPISSDWHYPRTGPVSPSTRVDLRAAD